MDDYVLNSNIDQKMAKMRLKNLELLKRHQEIEEDRQQAVQSGATTVTETMRSTKNRTRLAPNPQIDSSYERSHRVPIRRKFENDRTDNPPQRAQRVDYNRLKYERVQELNNNSKASQLQEYTFHNQSETNHQNFSTKFDFHHSETDGPTQAKKLVIVNNKADRIGSGRFNQEQRTQEKAQRKREERMRRTTTTTTVQSNGPARGTNEFHLDISPMSIWPNAPMHVQLIPHHTGIDHLINTSADQIDQSPFITNFVYSTPTPATPFNNNGTVYFAQPTQTHFHQYHSPRTFENTNLHQYHLSTFQTSPIFPPPPSSATIPQSLPTPTENSSPEHPVHFRRLKTPEYENKSRPISTDFERLHNTHPTAQRFQSRPQSFYDFSPKNFVRPQRNNNNNTNTSLPLSAYMDTNKSDNYRMQTHQRRKVPQRSYHHDKHQFPLSSYDISQYTFNNNSSQRRTNGNNNRRQNFNGNSNEIDLIEEWWEDNETESIGTKPKTTTTTIDDSGNSSLSTSMHLKETTIDEFANPPSDLSTTDSNIIESLDKLQEQLKLEEDVDEHLASNESTTKELTPYDTAHFMQWAKQTFREELAGRLTAQEIEQHDAVTTEDDENLLNQLDHLEDDLNEKLTIENNQSK